MTHFAEEKDHINIITARKARKEKKMPREEKTRSDSRMFYNRNTVKTLDLTRKKPVKIGRS